MTRQTEDITVVSGLPRSGTSLMMQLLAAGGVTPLIDNLRAPDEDNPRGYFEFEQVKQLKHDKTWLGTAHGKVVKIVHLLLLELPMEYHYRIIFMRRRLDEILASQTKMLQRQGRVLPPGNSAGLANNFERQVGQVLAWLAARPNFRVLEIWHHELLARPASQARVINSFLGGHLNESAMAAAVDPGLYRNRSCAPPV